MPLCMFPQPEEWWDEDKELLWRLDDPDYVPTDEEMGRYRELKLSERTQLTRRPRAIANYKG